MNTTQGEIPSDDREEVDDHPVTYVDEASPERGESQSQAEPALSITVQSWATPVVGLVMLAVGLLAGYLGRPLVDKADPQSSQAEVSPAPTAVPGASASTSPNAQQQALMEALIAQTVHFKGDPSAPVTLIEFSDFQ